MLLIEPFNAITSWENYEYQGHVALYIALKKIYELLQMGKSISGYDLQIEGEEDFSIRKDSKYLSLHQVKAGAIHLNVNYKFSFIIGILQTKAEMGYFHISSEQAVPSDFVSETLNHISELQQQLAKKVVEKKDVLPGDSEDKYIILDKISGNHKKADVYSLIKYVSENSKDIEIIRLTVRDISNALDGFETVIKKKVSELESTAPALPSDEAFFKVHKERFDNAKQIRQKAYEVIVELLRIKRPEYTFVDIDYAALVYDQLLLYMKARITDFYIAKNKTGKCILTFDEIVEQIMVDYHEKIDTISYQYFQVLKGIRDAYAEYPNEKWTNCDESNCKDCDHSNECNLFKQIAILNKQPEDKKNRIIHNLLLKTPVKGKSNNLPQDSLISHLFLNLLDEIKTIELGKNNAYETVSDNGETYRLTLDSSYNVDEFQSNLKKEISKEADRSLLFECDVLITDRLRKNSLRFNGGDINILTEKEVNEISDITSFTIDKMKKNSQSPKIIRLIDKEKALGELKHE